MRYLGGKQRIGKQIAEYINQFAGEFDYYEPFCGGNNIVPHLGKFNSYNLSDVNEDLILMYNALKEGWLPPDSMSEEEYRDLRSSHQSALRAFAGFGCSFSGKWFGGYARDNTGRNYCRNARNSLLKKLDSIRKSNFLHCSYNTINPVNSLIYADPPYKNTTRYDYVGEFNHEKFWDKVRGWSESNIVIISEYSAPEDFICIKEIKTKTDMRVKGGLKEQRVERLFVYVGVIDRCF